MATFAREASMLADGLIPSGKLCELVRERRKLAKAMWDKRAAGKTVSDMERALFEELCARIARAVASERKGQ